MTIGITAMTIGITAMTIGIICVRTVFHTNFLRLEKFEYGLKPSKTF